MAASKKAKPRRDSHAKYTVAITKLAEVVGGWIKEDGRSLDDYLDQVATDLESLVKGGAR